MIRIKKISRRYVHTSGCLNFIQNITCIALFFITTLIFSFSAKNVDASVVDSGTVYNYNGTDYTIALDETNETEWLSLKATAQMSIDDVLGSTLSSDWSIANDSEWISFFDSVSTGKGSSPSPGSSTDLDNLWAAWPGLDPVLFSSTSAFFGLWTDGSTATMQGYMQGSYPQSDGLNWVFSTNSGQSTSWTHPSADHGVWMFRSSTTTTVPIPPTGFLFGSGILGLIWFYKKRSEFTSSNHTITQNTSS